MAYAEVAVNSPGAGRGTFSYAVPPHLPVEVGHGVWVPFGRQRLLGVVFALSPQPSFTPVRDIEGLVQPEPLLSPRQVELSRWLAETCFVGPFEASVLLLPPGFPRRPQVRYQATPGGSENIVADLEAEAATLLAWLERHGPAGPGTLGRHFGKGRAEALISSLERRGLVARLTTWPRPRQGPGTIPYLRLAVSPERAQQEAQQREGRAPRQAALLRRLGEAPYLPLAELSRAGFSAQSIRAIVAEGLVHREVVPRTVDPLLGLAPEVSPPPEPTPAQAAALEAIARALEAGRARTFLLHGVTGSGKTEVYLRAVAQAAALGRRAIVLVPEIALTPQTLSRFTGRFPGQVAVLHSRLSPAEHLDQWQRVRQGCYQVVVGSRGAVFAPQPDLGLIVMDEEHEWTYKQTDTSPRYHAREVALKLAELHGAVVVLGSATPDVESYYRVQRGDYARLELPGRISHRGEVVPLPRVSVVDMREEWKAGYQGLFSRELREVVARALEAGEQVILFLNRRGSATTIQCRACGWVLRCRRCALSLTYHEAGDALVCHQCNSRSAVPGSCPQCGRRSRGGFRFLGAGTQRVEAEAAALFPGARLLRWDLDVTRGRRRHEEVLRCFREHQADILVGTQMVAKGLDLPLVTVVGVINADVQLNLPDFRAGERTFQLITQVAGRAGRWEGAGQVIVQTFNPQHYAILAAARHDYASLYEREIAFRRTYNYPPLSRLVRLLYADSSAQRSQQRAQRLARALREAQQRLGQATEVLGPAPAYPPRVRGRYRWHILLRGPAPEALLAQVPLPLGWTVDVGPVSLA